MKLLPLAAAVATCMATMAVANTERDLDSHEHGAALMNVAIDNDSLLIELETPWNNLVGFEHAPGNEEQEEMVHEAMEALEEPEDLFDIAGGGCEHTSTTIENTMAMGDDHHDDHDDDHKDGDGHDHDDDHKDEHDHDDDHKEADGHDHDDDHKDGHGHDDHKDEHDHDDDHKDGHGHDDHKDEHDHDDDHKDGHGHDDHDDHKDADGHDDHDHDGETHSSLLVAYAYTCENVGDIESIDVELFEKWSGFEDIDVQLLGPGGTAGAELSADAHELDMTPVM